MGCTPSKPSADKQSRAGSGDEKKPIQAASFTLLVDTPRDEDRTVGPAKQTGTTTQPQETKTKTGTTTQPQETKSKTGTKTGTPLPPNVAESQQQKSGTEEKDLEPKSQDGRDAISKVKSACTAIGFMGKIMAPRFKALHQVPAEDLDVVGKLVKGDFDVECPRTIKTVRIFVSSTFTDTKHERDWLMEHVYPNLREFCQKKGYDFQVVDMRWGIREAATDDHRTTEICLHEIDLCKKLSTGPCFLSLMSHKYGNRGLPRKIRKSDFDKMLEHIDNEDVKTKINKWYKQDDNEKPVSFILQPISNFLPGFISKDEKEQKAAKEEWWCLETDMMTALARAASQVPGGKTKDIDDMAKQRSVSDKETIQCINDAGPGLATNALWYHRIFDDIDNVDVNKDRRILSKFKDLSDNPERDNNAKKQLDELLNKVMREKLPESNIKEYHEKWQAGKGIDPVNNENHKVYLKRLCDNALEHMRGLVKRAIDHEQNATVREPLFEEITQHTEFCQSKCKHFEGRADSLNKIRAYLTDASKTDSSKTVQARSALVVHGPSGCGKTSLMAKTVEMANQIAKENGDDKSIIIFRFLGTSPDSTTLRRLLMSLIDQMRMATGNERHDLSKMSLPRLKAMFLLTTLSTSRNRRLVIVLDSLDQLDNSDDAHSMDWLNTLCVKNTWMVLSTLPAEPYKIRILPILWDRLKERHSDNFIEIPDLPQTDSLGILDTWLEAKGRQLTSYQYNCVIDAFMKCQLPLFLKLSFDEACKWNSYTPDSEALLETTVRQSINKLFDKLEVIHGAVFVSKALGYLSASDMGLAETELEDVLSCDEDVLNNVYQFWEPSVRRLPPLLLIRMKADFEQYVVYRGVDDKQVFFWYHRQFIEASRERYCNDRDARSKELHQGLADYFSGKWAEGKEKEYIAKDKNEKKANRFLASQPMKIEGNKWNKRRINRLPMHVAKAGWLDQLKEDHLINLDFMNSKTDCSGLRSVLEDFRLAREIYKEDKEIEGTGGALQLSQQALVHDKRTFASQIHGRIRHSEFEELPLVSKFLGECEKANSLFLVSDRPVLTQPGGPLENTVNDSMHTHRMVANKDVTKAVTISKDDTLRLFDLQKNGKIAEWKLAKHADVVRLACGDSIAIVRCDDGLSAYALTKETGTRKWHLPTNQKKHFVVCGKGDNSFVLLDDGKYSFYNAETGHMLGEPVSLPEGRTFSPSGPSIGHGSWIVAADVQRTAVFVISVQNQSLVKYKRLLKPYKYEAGEEVEKTVSALTISHDGKTLYASSYHDNDLNLIHTETLETYKTLSGCKWDKSERFHLSLNGKYIYFPNTSYVRVWELSTGKKAALFNVRENKGIDEVYSADMNRFLTCGNDRDLRIWNVTKVDKEGIRFEDLSPFAHPFHCKTLEYKFFAPTENPEIFVGVWIDTKEGMAKQTVVVFDASTSTFLRQAHHEFHNTKNGKHKNAMSDVRYLRDWQIAFSQGRRVKFLDLKTMKVRVVLQGQLPKKCVDILSVNNGKDFAFATKGRKGVKVLSGETGKTKFIMKHTDATERIKRIVTNKGGSVVVASCGGPFFLVFKMDAAGAYKASKINKNDTECCDDVLSLDKALITDDGQYLLFIGMRKLEKSPHEFGSQVQYAIAIHVYNLQKDKSERTLHDQIHSKSSKMFGQKGFEARIHSIKVIDNERLVSTHDDHVVRVYDYKRGGIMHQLKGHRGQTVVSHRPGSPILLTHGFLDEERGLRNWDQTLRIWDINDGFALRAMFRFDHDMRHFHVVHTDTCRAVALLESEAKPVLFEFQGEESKTLVHKQDKTYPRYVPEKGGVARLDLAERVDLKELDADDPDSDEEDKDLLRLFDSRFADPSQDSDRKFAPRPALCIEKAVHKAFVYKAR